MAECKLCGKNGEDLSLFSANHKKWGKIMVCQECWAKLYDGNHMVCGSSSCDSCSSCGSCSTCG